MLLQLNNISKGYGIPGSHAFRPVLTNLDLQVAKSERIAIVGPSGSGKTTLLNIAGALDRPDSGEVLFGDEDISRFGDIELARFRNRKLDLCFSNITFYPNALCWKMFCFRYCR